MSFADKMSDDRVIAARISPSPWRVTVAKTRLRSIFVTILISTCLKRAFSILVAFFFHFEFFENIIVGATQRSLYKYDRYQFVGQADVITRIEWQSNGYSFQLKSIVPSCLIDDGYTAVLTHAPFFRSFLEAGQRRFPDIRNSIIVSSQRTKRPFIEWNTPRLPPFAASRVSIITVREELFQLFRALELKSYTWSIHPRNYWTRKFRTRRCSAISPEALDFEAMNTGSLTPRLVQKLKTRNYSFALANTENR